MLTLWLPAPGQSSLVEFGSAIPEGLHRCTTKTANWYLKPEILTDGSPIMDQFYPCDITNPHLDIVKDSEKSVVELLSGDSLEQTEESTTEEDSETISTTTEKPKPICEEEDARRYHLYRLLNINALLIVVDPPKRPSKFDGTVEEWSDGPVEGKRWL